MFLIGMGTKSGDFAQRFIGTLRKAVFVLKSELLKLKK
jgi:hypothetical protein